MHEKGRIAVGGADGIPVFRTPRFIVGDGRFSDGLLLIFTLPQWNA